MAAVVVIIIIIINHSGLKNRYAGMNIQGVIFPFVCFWGPGC